MGKTALSRTDKIFYLFCTAVIAGASFLLYNEFTKKIKLQNGMEECALLYIDNIVRRKYHSQVIWEPIEHKGRVYYGDTVRTGNNSTANALMKDGTRVVLDENSMVQFEKLEDRVRLQALQGNLFINRAAESKSQLDSIMIKLGNIDISTENGSLEIMGDDDPRIIVRSGSADLTINNKSYTLQENTIATITGSDSEPRFIKNSMVPVYPGHNSILTSCDKQKEIEFTFRSAKKNNTLEIAENKDFKPLLVSQKTSGTSTVISLKPGSYFWRITDNETTDRPETLLFNRFTIIDDRPVLLKSPQDNQQFAYITKNPLIDFSWEESRFAAGYTLEISGNREFSSIVKKINVPGSSISIDSLTRGAYYWRVNARTFFNLCPRSPHTVRSFTIISKNSITGLKTVSPKNNTLFFTKNQEEHPLIFSCEENRQIDIYTLVIARDREMNNTLFTKTSYSNFIESPVIKEEGTYYWRIDAGLNNREAAVSSTTQVLHLADPRSLVITSPPDKSLVLSGPGSTKARVTFAWKGPAGSPVYNIKIYRNDDMKKPINDLSTVNSSVTVDNLVPGAYSWHLQVTNSDGYHSFNTGPYHFSVKNILRPPRITGPAQHSRINLIKTKTVRFAWKQRSGATGYLFTLYRLTGNKKEQLHKQETDNTEITLDIESFGKGRFMWTVQALDIDDANTVLRKSTVKQRYFSLVRSVLAKPVIEDIEIQ